MLDAKSVNISADTDMEKRVKSILDSAVTQVMDEIAKASNAPDLLVGQSLKDNSTNATHEIHPAIDELDLEARIILTENKLRPMLMQPGSPLASYYAEIDLKNSYHGKLLINQLHRLDLCLAEKDDQAVKQTLKELGKDLYQFLNDQDEVHKFHVANEWTEELSKITSGHAKIFAVRPGEAADITRMSFRPGINSVNSVSSWIVWANGVACSKASVS